ncbi:hypothetical protein B0H10DRAFT_636077 [Mycena sp. CBHHK59/15]|nr:hypothetical protein B0H10DRAFT_636077 [Mycena sp. CBHHK59/15]
MSAAQLTSVVLAFLHPLPRFLPPAGPCAAPHDALDALDVSAPYTSSNGFRALNPMWQCIPTF